MRRRHFEVKLVKDAEPTPNEETVRTITTDDIVETVRECSKYAVVAYAAIKGINTACRAAEHLIVTKL